MGPAELEETLRSWKPAVVVLAANRLGVLAELARQPLTAGALAERLGLDERAVAALTDALVSLSLLRRDGENLAVAEALREVVDPASPSTLAHIWEHQWFLLQRWVRLEDVVRGGEPLPRSRDDEERTRAFVGGMADLGRRSGAAFWERVDLSGCSHLVDVGGGPGEHARAALERFPGLRVTVLDFPEVIAVARETAGGNPIDERLTFQEGDVLGGPIPACDAALLSSLLRGYGGEEVARIAANVAAGMRPGGTLLIREMLWPDACHSGPPSTGLMHVNMLVSTPSGRCYTAQELETLFGRAGFGDWQRIPLDPRTTLLFGRRLPV